MSSSMTHRAVNVAQLSGRALDYQMYLHGCKVLEQPNSLKEFETGYDQGRYHFSSDSSLLLGLLESYRFNLQFLAGEWLASNTQASVYSPSPLEAVSRLVLLVNYGPQGVPQR